MIPFVALPPTPAAMVAVAIQSNPVSELAAPILADLKQRVASVTAPEEKGPLLLRIAHAEKAMGNEAAAKAALLEGAALVRKANLEGAAILPFLVGVTYHDLGDDAGAKRYLAESVPLAQKIANTQTRFYVLYQIVSGQAYVGDMAGARKTLVAVKAAAPKAGDERAKAEADLFIQLRDFAEAKRTISRIQKDLGNKALTFATLAEAQRKKGDAAGAKATLATAFQTAQQIKDPGERQAIISILLPYQVRLGDVAGAKKSAGKSSENRKSIAETQAEMGDAAGAQATYPKPTAELAYALARTGKVAEAQMAAQAVIEAKDFSMQDEPMRLWAAIAAAQARAGDTSGATESLAKAKVLATTKDEIFGDNSTAMLGSLLEALFTGGKREW